MLKNVKIRTRLFFGFCVLLVMLLAVSVFSIIQMNRLAQYTQEMYDHPLTVSNTILAAETNIIKMHRSMKDVSLSHNGEQLNEDQLDIAVETVDQLEGIVNAQLAIVWDKFLGEKSEVTQLQKDFEKWKPLRDEVIQLTRQKQFVRAAAMTSGKGTRYIERLTDSMKRFSNFAGAKAAEFLQSAQKAEKSAYIIVGIIVGFAIILSLLIAFLITRSITTPVKIAADVADNLSRGQLNVDVTSESKDEMGSMLSSLGSMTVSLREQIRELIEGISVLATSAAEISSTTAQFATTTQE